MVHCSPGCPEKRSWGSKTKAVLASRRRWALCCRAAWSAVKRYQASNGLAPTGIVDKRTIAALNIPAASRLKQLKTNLARFTRLLQGQRDMTPDTAIRCARQFGIDAAFWLAQQAGPDALSPLSPNRR